VSRRRVLILALALIAGVSAVVAVNALRQPVPPSEAKDSVIIVVATADIPRFTTIAADMVTTHSYPKDLVPIDALYSVEEALDRVVYVPLNKDEPVLNSKLVAKGLGRGKDARIPDGMEAYTIRTPTRAAGVAGFILPGNRVDVRLTDRAGGRTTPILQDVAILAVDQRVDAPAENKVNDKELRSVTLLVTLEQATMLALGQAKGILHLSLRDPNDRKP
jgi:pilus assembly protein CpaB